MNARLLTVTCAFVAATALLLGCSTPLSSEPAAAVEHKVASVTIEPVAPKPPHVAHLAQIAEIRPYRGPLPPPPEPGSPWRDPALAAGKVCRLGTSCLEMDSRPFELCLLGTNKHCGDKVRESLLVENPGVVVPR